MKTQTIKGNYWSLQFYYPVGKKQLYGQIYDNKSDEMIDEDIVKTQEDYDFFIEVLTIADNNKSKTENITPMFV
jgi:hypothetical protein